MCTKQGCRSNRALQNECFLISSFAIASNFQLVRWLFHLYKWCGTNYQTEFNQPAKKAIAYPGAIRKPFWTMLEPQTLHKSGRWAWTERLTGEIDPEVKYAFKIKCIFESFSLCKARNLLCYVLVRETDFSQCPNCLMMWELLVVGSACQTSCVWPFPALEYPSHSDRSSHSAAGQFICVNGGTEDTTRS